MNNEEKEALSGAPPSKQMRKYETGEAGGTASDPESNKARDEFFRGLMDKDECWKLLDSYSINYIKHHIIRSREGQLFKWNHYSYEEVDFESITKRIYSAFESRHLLDKCGGKKFLPTKVFAHVKDYWRTLKERTIVDCRSIPKSIRRRKISFNNVILDLENLNEVPLPIDPKENDCIPMSFNRVQYDFDPEATAPVWEKFLEEVFENDTETINMLQRYCGYILEKDCRHKRAMFLIGQSGNNGKSVLLETIVKAIGESNCIERELKKLDKGFYTSDLANKLLMYNTEMSQIGRSESANFKKIVSGEPLFTEVKFGAHGVIQPSLKLMMASNHLPKISIDAGVTNRALFCVFQRSFSEEEQDKSLADKLETELSGIFNWMLVGRDLLRKEGISHSPKSREMLNKFIEANSSVESFWINSLNLDYEISGEDDYVTKDPVYMEYSSFCGGNNQQAMTKSNFWEKSYSYLYKVAKEKSLLKEADYFRKPKETKKSITGKRVRVVMHLRKLSG